MFKKLKQLWCWKFGHHFTKIQSLIFIIKARNAPFMAPPRDNPKIACASCGKVFSLQEFTTLPEALKKEFPDVYGKKD